MGLKGIRMIGDCDTKEYRVYLESEEGKVLSYFHDVPLVDDAQKGYFNMVMEIGRWTNGKYEISREEEMNPIKQDIKKGELRYVKNVFPFQGYPWNYGALPQTWEDPEEVSSHTGFKGDGDPIDVIDIGGRIGFIGEIKRVKILGCLGLVDEGETDWKIVSIDVEDPRAKDVEDIEDVEKVFPGLLENTRRWFRIYKVPEGKGENQFAFEGEYKNKKFAVDIIEEGHGFWQRMIMKEGREGVCRKNKTVEKSDSRVACDGVERGKSIGFKTLYEKHVPMERSMSFYIK